MSIYTNFAPVVHEDQIDDQVGPAACTAHPTRLGLTARRARHDFRAERAVDVARVSDVRPAAAGVDGRRSAQHIQKTRPSAHPIRLTHRAYVLAGGLVVAVIAGWSALSLATASEVAHVPTTSVVVRGGETVDDVAARTADGRDAGEVAQLIKAANGLPDSASIDAGEVLVVPGS